MYLVKPRWTILKKKKKEEYRLLGKCHSGHPLACESGELDIVLALLVTSCGTLGK